MHTHLYVFILVWRVLRFNIINSNKKVEKMYLVAKVNFEFVTPFLSMRNLLQKQRRFSKLTNNRYFCGGSGFLKGMCVYCILKYTQCQLSEFFPLFRLIKVWRWWWRGWHDTLMNPVVVSKFNWKQKSMQKMGVHKVEENYCCFIGTKTS